MTDEELLESNLAEMRKGVVDATKINDARIAYLELARGVRPDPAQLLEVKFNLLAELILEGATIGQKLWFEFTYQKRLAELLELLEEQARSKPEESHAVVS